MSQDIAKLLRQFDTLAEAKVTPVGVKKGLNQQQRRVPQLPALFKPRTISVLQNPHDPKHPAAGYAVGASESRVSKTMAAEDVLGQVQKKLGDYLQDVKKAVDKDPDLMHKLVKSIDHLGPAVKTVKTHDGHEIKIHGNEDDGFRITIRNRPMTQKFGDLDEAVKVCEMYCAKRSNHSNNDYVEES